MMNRKMIFWITVMVMIALTACNKNGSSGSARTQSGGKTINSADELRTYLNSQPVNGPDKPIRVSMTINNPMIESVGEVIKSAGKYVSLNITANALTTIPEGAFGDCETLVSITIPNSVNEIGDSAFLHCTNLASINVPNGVTKIGPQAFGSCTSLATITIPNGITRIEYQTFYYCKSLVSITIPDSVTFIYNWAFGGCTSLTSVTFQGTISANGLNRPIDGDLREKYLAGGIGTYTRPDGDSLMWTKQ
jgi:hypothetical protein